MKAASLRSSKSNEEALEVVLEAITKAGYTPGEQIGIALDPAASEFYDKDKKKYVFKKSDKSERTSDEMVKFWADWVKQYPIVSIEDGMAEDDWDGWKMHDRRTGRQDPTGRRRSVCHQHRSGLQQGIEKGIANSILIKVNQIGTLTETLEAIKMARRGLHCRSSRTARARPKTRSSPIWRWRPARARSRPARRAAPIASRNTINCCASKRNWAKEPGSLVWTP